MVATLDFSRLLPRRYCPWVPTPKQLYWLTSTARVSLYGGRARGGKSVGLLMRGTQYVECPHFAALLLRKTYPDLNQPKGLMAMAREWFTGTGARWNSEQHSWTFPSGAVIQFGFLESESDVYRYQGASYQLIGVDELAQHRRFDWGYLSSRLTLPAGSNLPLALLGTSNPPTRSQKHRHGDWVKREFVDPATRGDREYIEAGIDDNPHEDRAAYEISLRETDPVTRRQLLEGDWDIQAGGNFFKREWFRVVRELPHVTSWARGWDLAASDADDADWTTGVKIGRHAEGVVVAHVQRGRWTSGARDRVIGQTVAADGRGVKQDFEVEPGSGGKAQVETIRTGLLGAWTSGDRATGSKEARAGAFASAAELGRVWILAAPWNEPYLDELSMFPDGEHDDQVDGSSRAFAALALGPSAGPASITPTRPVDEARSSILGTLLQ